jgi:NADP-dependent 3-hydroxy acid dehydrogenase YdfG
MLARRKERLDGLHGEPGDRAVGIACDVTDLDSPVGGVDEAVRSLGGVDAVITVAGRGMVGTIASGTPQAGRDLLDVKSQARLGSASLGT